MKKRRGGILILTVIVLAAVTTILATAVAVERLAVKDTAYRLERARARIAAESGIARAMSAFLALDAALVSQADEWYTIGNQSNDLITVGAVSFRMQIIDASSLINLNVAPEPDLPNLGLSTEQIDSLLDWREEGATPRTEGAKDEFYNSLEYPYNAKLRRMDAVDEVMQIKGFDAFTLLQAPSTSNTSGVTPRPLYAWATVDSYSPNTSNGQQKQNINTVQANQLTQAGIPAPLAAAIIARRNQVGGQFATLGDALRVNGMTLQAAGSLADGFMVGGEPRSEGRINVNTASEDVLLTIDGMTTDVAQAITSRQDPGLQSLSELLQVPGFTIDLAQRSIDRFTTTSETFIVRIEGRAGAARVPLEAVISINGGRTRLVKVYDPPLGNMTELWGWPEETTNELDLGGTQ